MSANARNSSPRLIALITALIVGAGCLVAAVIVAATGHPPLAEPGAAVPVRAVPRHPVRIPSMRPAPRPGATWPAAASATLDLATGRSQATAHAGGLTVTIGPAATSGRQRPPGVTRATVRVSSHGAARALGLHGVVLAVDRADGVRAAGRVRLSVGYARLARAYGGDFGARLELAELPSCAVTAPAAAACRREHLVGSRNNTRKDSVSADVTLPATLALVAGPSGSAGNFAAEPMSEATNDWVTGQSSGAYTYAYPLTVPPVPGGLEPSVSLNYDSLTTMGLSSSTNNEASWVGDGWNLSPGYIEMDYSNCAADPEEPKTGDLCGDHTEAVLSFEGMTTPLVDGANGWQAEADSGAKITESNNTWELIEPNGVQYYFGLNQLPGYASGDASTNSQWTVPVWEGCGQAGFCTLPWRDMLSYVVDPHGDAIAYHYTTQTNSYAESDGSTANGTYTQGGALSSIEYGFRAGQFYSSVPAAQVNFTVATTRQDAPTDLSCAPGAACAITSPTFWSTDQLTGISTQALENGAMANVDSWSLSGSYPATGDPTTSPSLWLSSITRTGQDGGTPLSLPPVTFSGTPLPNRVETAADTSAGYSAITRFYLTSVTNDTGGVTSIAYSAPYSASTFPAPDANTTTAYPDYWLPADSTTPVLDWFNTYAADTVTQQDTTGGDPPVVTSYAYSSPAWHYDNGTISRSATVTWDQFRGYQSVTTKTGTAPDPVTESVTSYLQGMSQDGPPGDPGPVVALTTSRGQTITDSDQFAGMAAETIVYDGAGSGQEVTDTITDPWSSAATATNSSLDQAAYLTGPGSTQIYTALGGGGVREAVQSFTYNSDDLVSTESNVPDTSNAAKSSCTTTTYAANTATWLLDLPETVATTTGACGSSGGTLISQTDTLYDGGGLGASPTAGNATKTEQAVTGGVIPTFVTSTASYDEYGRVLTSTDPDGGAATTTSYTPATGAEPTSQSVTDPMGLVTITTYDPAREQPLTTTDPAGVVTTEAYDALGRQTAEWSAGNPSTGPPTATYSYTVSNTAPSVTTEQDLEPDGNQLTTQTLDDSFGQVREVQQETAGGGTDVTDTSYNSDGLKALTSNPYYVSGAPSGVLVEAAASSVPSQTGYVYDGDDRVVRQISYSSGTEAWETDTSYGGNYTTVTPPAGGTPETTWTDGRGLTTAIWQYHAGAPVSVSDPASDYDATTYTYTPAQKLATITDAAGNAWSYTYDLLGDQLTSTDPDAGATTSTYDAAQRLMSVTDARGKTISYTYDADGRKTAEYDTTGGAAESSADEIASWTYDTLAKGQLTSSTADEGGVQYTEEYTGYDAGGQPSGTKVIIPSAQGALAGTYTQDYTYAPDGQETSYTDSAAGGLPAETVTLGYDSAGEEDSLTGASAYVDSLSYTNLGQPLQYTMGDSAEPVYVTDSYDPQTGNLTQQNTQDGTAPTQVDDLNYTYNDVGSITSEADTPSAGPADVQCFSYDYLNRLVQAWAQGSAGCSSAPSASAEGGAAPYWESYSYNTIGNLTGITSTTPSGAVTTTTNSYPATGAAHPHGISGQTVTSPSGTTTSTYGYDADGNLATVTGTGQNQSLTWNNAGQLTQDSVTPSGGTAQGTSYIYNADGTLLLTRDPGTTTLYLGDEELSLDSGTGVVTGTRYYSLGSTTVATLTGASSLAWVIGDQQGTDSLAISATNLTVSRRYYDPYGNSIGTPAAGFPTGEKGFVGGATDTATSLTDLGAREYQSGTGSFISADPELKPYNPQDLNAYTYAADNPTTFSDPTGESAAASADNTYYIPGCTGADGEASYTAPTQQAGITCADVLGAQSTLGVAAPTITAGNNCPAGYENCFWEANSNPNFAIFCAMSNNGSEVSQPGEVGYCDFNFSATALNGAAGQIEKIADYIANHPDKPAGVVTAILTGVISYFGAIGMVPALATVAAVTLLASLGIVIVGTKASDLIVKPVVGTLKAVAKAAAWLKKVTVGNGTHKASYGEYFHETLFCGPMSSDGSHGDGFNVYQDCDSVVGDGAYAPGDSLSWANPLNAPGPW